MQPQPLLCLAVLLCADIAGADTATLNASASQSYNAMVADAKAKGQLDTSSATYSRINAVFNRLKPYANQLNQTGTAFQWQLAVLKSGSGQCFCGTWW